MTSYVAEMTSPAGASGSGPLAARRRGGGPEWKHGSILSVIYPSSEDSTTINLTRFSQPAIFAVEYSLFEFWKSKGVVPDVMMGHSVGEYVAACVAGVFSLKDGLRLIAARGAFTNDLDPMNGVMVAIRAGYASILLTVF